jgi:hypothetical protein
MRRKLPKQALQEAMAHFEVVADYGSGDLSDQKTIDAICMRLSAGIEALSGLSNMTAMRCSATSGLRCGGCATASRTATSWSSRR